MRNIFIYVFFVLLSLTVKNHKAQYVIIETEYGKIKIKLYKDVPKHRENFLKLVKQKFYDSLLFHRVIKGFVIQGGDPNSKRAKPGELLGIDVSGHTIPAEFNSKYFHKKGAVAAARLPDHINPTKESSGSQFYIVQGRIYTNEELNILENIINQKKKNQILEELLLLPEYSAYKKKRDEILSKNDKERLLEFLKEVEPILEKELEKRGRFKFTNEQREIYTTIGGAPHLDGEYTVFGEVIEGLDVVDKIAEVETDSNNRPLKDIRMKVYLQKQ